MADLAIFVSRRLQRACCALLCLVLAQLVLAACEPEPPGARIALADQNSRDRS